MAFFSDFYFVICLSSPSILVVYDTDNKLSLLSLSLSPDLSCFQLANPPPQCNATQHLLAFTLFSKHTPMGKGKAPGLLRGGEQANSFLYYEKKNFCPKNDGKGGSSSPKSLGIPPKPRPPGPGITPRVAGSTGEISVRNLPGLTRRVNLY